MLAAVLVGVLILVLGAVLRIVLVLGPVLAVVLILVIHHNFLRLIFFAENRTSSLSRLSGFILCFENETDYKTGKDRRCNTA